jgi:acetyltransferase-like isoleucine patch superfamily enzyme
MSAGIVWNNGPIPGRRRSQSASLAGVACFLIALAAFIALPACSDADNGDGSTKVNGSVHVAAGKPPVAATTVNGSIHIDDNAAVTNASTVNGSVHLGEHATAKSLQSVNGAITLGTGAHLSGDASSVNGELTLAEGAEILGSLSNVNGKITLTSAHVGTGIKTVNGGISITGASHVEGGIVVERPGTQLIQITHDVPRIVIGPGATVQGELRFERDVHLYVSDKATIGKVTGATPISFSGDSPPN